MSIPAIVIDRLQNGGAKKTPNRLRLLEILLSTQQPLSAYELQASAENLNISTVYRNLELFTKLGIVHKIVSIDKYLACDFQKDNTCDLDHGFLVCRKCDSVSEFVDEHDCAASELTAARQTGFTCEEHIKEILGTCAKCNNI